MTSLAKSSTERSYYENTYRYTLQATIKEVGEDDKGNYVIFDKSIFHPQGGGQPDDKGKFVIGEKHFSVRSLSAPANPYETPYLIKHYFESSENLPKNEETALQIIDRESRKVFARWHSAGHLISNALHTLYPQLDGCSGNHFPGQAFVIFRGEPIPTNLQEVQTKVEALANQYIEQNLEVTNRWNCTPRTIQFGTLPAYPCGGTHVQRSSEIGSIKIRSVKKEKMRASLQEIEESKKQGAPIEKVTILKVKYEVN